MENSWLVQRLCRPHPGTGLLAGKDNPFSFGGGMRNGGLSGEAMDLLRPIFRFDYMGAAEFEFGAVPKALQGLARSELVSGSFSLPLKKVDAQAPRWRRQEHVKGATGEVTIYLLCRDGDSDEVEFRVRGWASGKPENLKEWTGLVRALLPQNEWDHEVQGWLELDNGFMFFIDETMWRATCELFKVDNG